MSHLTLLKLQNPCPHGICGGGGGVENRQQANKCLDENKAERELRELLAW